MGLEVGGYTDRPDWPKLGQSLLIASCLILAIRTAKWTATRGAQNRYLLRPSSCLLMSECKQLFFISPIRIVNTCHPSRTSEAASWEQPSFRFSALSGASWRLPSGPRVPAGQYPLQRWQP
jgi:hypothetical protein